MVSPVSQISCNTAPNPHLSPVTGGFAIRQTRQRFPGCRTWTISPTLRLSCYLVSAITWLRVFPGNTEGPGPRLSPGCQSPSAQWWGTAPCLEPQGRKVQGFGAWGMWGSLSCRLPLVCRSKTSRYTFIS